MAKILLKHFSTVPFLLTILLFFSSFAAVESKSFSQNLSPLSLGLKRQKLSHLHFYFHDIVVGKNPTAIRVAQAPTTSASSPFGALVMIDDPLTINPDINSKLVGKAQGIYAIASQSDASLLMAYNFAFTEGKYNGSNLSVLGRNSVFSSARELPVIGGSGVFRFARGYAEAKTPTLGATLVRHRSKPRVYIGCTKSHTVIAQKSSLRSICLTQFLPLLLERYM